MQLLEQKTQDFNNLLNDVFKQYNFSIDNHQKLAKRIAGSKSIIEKQPAINEILDNIQNRIHQQTLGKFEKLLTAIVNDVFPDRGLQVVLQLKLERNQPALKVLIKKNTGHLEDVMTGKGGSITNIISVGLRFIVLTRCKGAIPFIVLDEADCWMSPKRIPAYANVLNWLSKLTGVQVVMISHHDTSLFHDTFNVHLNQRGQLLKAELRGRPCEWPEEKKGLRKIVLHNFMSHKHTEIPLSPNVTTITGDNDLGKSVIVQSLRSALYNEGHEAFIRHDTDKYTVDIDFGPAGVLIHSRKRKGQRKVFFRLIRGDDIVHESDKARLPEWIFDELGVGLINDELDVQLGDQKKPVFMLNEPATLQAKLLSVGREAQYLAEMQSDYKKDIQAEKRMLKRDEKDYANIDRELSRIEYFEDLEKECENLIYIDLPKLREEQLKIEKLETIISNFEKLKPIVEQKLNVSPEKLVLSSVDRLIAFIGNIERLGWANIEKPEKFDPVIPEDTLRLEKMVLSLHRLREIGQNPPVLASSPILPKLEPVDNLAKSIRGFSQLEFVSRISRTEKIDAVIPEDEKQIEKLVSKIKSLSKMENIGKLSESVSKPEFLSTEAIIKLGVGIKDSQDKYKKNKVKYQKIKTELDQCYREKQKLFKEAGGICPVCQQVYVDKGMEEMADAV